MPTTCYLNEKNNEELRLSAKSRYAVISTGTTEIGLSDRETNEDRYKRKKQNYR